MIFKITMKIQQRNPFLSLADMDAQDTAGNTPLHLTVEDDAFDAMDYLLSM